MSKQKFSQDPGQTQVGKYSVRLSNKADMGVHQSFRDEEPFFRQVLESLEDCAVFTTDLEGHISSWNAGAQNLLGYNEEEIIGHSASELYLPADNKKNVLRKEMSNAKKTGRTVDERYHIRKDNSIFLVGGMMFALYDDKGKIRGFTKLMRDITYKQVYENTIIKAKEYAESIVDTAREPLLVLNKDFTVNSANRSFYKTFKVLPKATIGKSIYTLGDGQWNIPALKGLLEDILPYNSTFNDFELVHNFEKIGHKTMLLNARKLWRVGNETELILLAIEDVTEKRLAEQFKNVFIGIASHEFKGPVSTIKGYAQILQKRALQTKDKMAAGILQKINLQANKLSEMISHLLDISRVQSGKLQLEKDKFDLNQLTAEIIEDLQAGYKHRTIIQQGSFDQYILADKFRIGQVLTNLISNALKYSPEGSDIVVNLKENESRTFGTVSIHDFGIGIPDEDQQYLFRAYGRASNVHQKKIPGIGLGLYICSEIVREHGGKIWFESKTNEGSLFHFSLPLEKIISKL